MAGTRSERQRVSVKSIPELLRELGKCGLGTMTRLETARWIARVILFERMEKTMSAELRILQESSLPLFRTLYETGREMCPTDHSDFPALVIREVLSDHAERTRRHYVEDWSSLCKAAEHFTAAKELVTAVSQWSEARHMNVDWFLDNALRNLAVWRKQPEVLHWSYQGGLVGGEHHRVGPNARDLHGWGTLDRVIPVPVVKPYNPSTQTREEHKAELEKDLNRYYAQQDDLFAAAGFQPTVLKRARTTDDPWLHIEWFIDYQMRGHSASQVAENHTLRAIGEDAIHRAVRDVATLLDAKLRGPLKGDLRRKRLTPR